MIGAKPYFCDICGHQKQLTNHWFIGFFSGNMLCFTTWDYAKERGTLNESYTKHFCGQECTSKYLSQFLTGVVNGVCN